MANKTGVILLTCMIFAFYKKRGAQPLSLDWDSQLILNMLFTMAKDDLRGGLAILVKTDLQCKIRQIHTKSNDMLLLIIKLASGRELFITNVYSRGGAHSLESLVLIELEDLLLDLNSRIDEMVGGDFNITFEPLLAAQQDILAEDESKWGTCKVVH